MKLRTTLLILAILLALFLSGCELFLAPKHQRNNPNDPDNPVQPVQDFQAVGISATEVSLSFVVPVLEDTAKAPVGYVIVRSEGDPPGWIDQGTLVAEDPAAAFTAGDTVVIADAGAGLEPDSEYWYTIWVHGDGEYLDHYTYSGSNAAITEAPPFFTALDEPGTYFSAFGTSGQAARIEWYYPPGSNPPPSHYLARYDGFFAPTSPTGGKGYAAKDDWGYDDWDLEAENEYTYAIFPADDDGSPYPVREGSAVVSDTATTKRIDNAAITINPDGYTDSTGEYLIQSSMIVGDDGSQSYGMMNIDPTAITNFGFLIEARLTLTTTATVPLPGEIEIKRIDENYNGGSWDDVSGIPTHDAINTGSVYVDDGYWVAEYVDSPSTPYTWDITPLVWRMIERGSFNGFILRSVSTGIEAEFQTTEGVTKPVLVIDYYED